MMTAKKPARTALKDTAQNDLLRGMVNAILTHEEGAYGAPDEAVIEEMRAQARRVMKLFGFESYPGLGSV